MKRKYLYALLATCCVATAQAQNVYDAERMATSDLNGTARFVSLGGAMGALGADISTMSSNPAGVGLLRKSEVSVTASMITQPEAIQFDGQGKSKASFDQVGFVYSSKLYTDAVPYLNIGFNYRKTRNFRNLLHGSTNAQALTGGAQGASLTWAWAEEGAHWANFSNDPFSSSTAKTILTPSGFLGYDTDLIAHDAANSTPSNNAFLTQNAYDHTYNQRVTGGISQYDFNLSTSIHDRLFLGMTFSAYDVRRTSYAAYLENYIYGASEGQFQYRNDEIVSGNGYDVKFGAIYRPIASSPFRVGVSVTTPTWYNISTTRLARLENFKDASTAQAWAQGEYGIDYFYRTPWKFNLSMGSTIEDYLAFGLEYEYNHLPSSSYSYNVDNYGYDERTKDNALNGEIDKYLRGQSTWRLGAEFKASPQFAVRVGYNHVTAPMKREAFLDQTVHSYSIDYTTNPAYLNLGAINRYTCGIGYRGKSFYADLAYQYQAQSGTLYSFYASNNGTNALPGHKVKMDRSQVMLTLGVRL